MEWIDRLQGMFEEHVPEEWRNSPYFLPGTIAVAVGTPFIFSLLQWNSKRIQEEPRWFSTNKAKTSTELMFFALSSFWMAFMVYIVATQWYESFDAWSYLYAGTAASMPYIIVPLLFPLKEERGIPIYNRYWFKANIWLWTLTFVGSYFWTHYFFKVLGASYSMPSHRLNDVPIGLYFFAHAYFMFYHTFTNLILRRFWTSKFWQGLPNYGRKLASAAIVLALAVFTAFMETWTISSFPYYSFVNRDFAYTVGSVFYGIYFIVSFPMYYRMDEVLETKGKAALPAFAQTWFDSMGRWTWWLATIDSMGACMIVTLLLDFWRLSLGGVVPELSTKLPFLYQEA